MWSSAVNGVLKGFDALMNLVLDEVQEVLRGMAQPPSIALINIDAKCKQMTKAIPLPDL